MSTTVRVSWQMMHPSYRVAVWLGELALIPSLAVFFSFLVYGPCELRKRALRIFLFGLLGVPILVLPIIIAAGLFAVLDSEFNSRGPTDAEAAAMFAIALLMWAMIGVVVFRVVRRIRMRTVELEAERWLHERRLFSKTEIRRRNRAIRIALWIPVSCVLLVFLFFPETWGLTSRVVSPGIDVPGYRVSVPATWFLVYPEFPDTTRQVPSNDRASHLGYSFFGGFMGTGIAGAPSAFFRDAWVPMSSWHVGSVASGTKPQQLPSAYHVLSQRRFTVGNETLTCYNYELVVNERHFGRDTTIDVECIGSGRLFASFSGEATHLEEFYRVLEGIRPQ